MKTLRHTVSILALGALAAACVTTESPSSPFSPQTFNGFASAPGATVDVYAYDYSLGRYESQPFATATADTTPIEFGGQTMYQWSIDARVIDDANDWCRVSPTCNQAEGTIRLQFREVGGQVNPLVTFDPGGVGCTITAVDGGADLLSAAWGCKGSHYEELWIYVIL